MPWISGRPLRERFGREVGSRSKPFGELIGCFAAPKAGDFHYIGGLSKVSGTEP